jgi:hypothetical protein
MHAGLQVVLAQMHETTASYPRALAGIGHEALLTRPGPRSNPMLWVAGHLTQARTRMLGAFGPPRTLPWMDLFATGSVIGDLHQYPGIGELVAVWRSASDELVKRIAALPEQRLGQRAPEWLASRDGTLLGALTFAAFHEAYHVGQMGYLRKWLGLEGILEPGALGPSDV